MAGAWTVAQGSQAGYRVKEQFAGQQATHEAVARTTSVSGRVTVQRPASGLQLGGLRITAQLADLQSSGSLAVAQYPSATFEATSAELPASVTSGQTVTVTIPGKLTIHGVARAASVTARVRMNGSQVQAAGGTTFAMTDFGVSPPRVPITQVDPQVTLEFQIVLARS